MNIHFYVNVNNYVQWNQLQNYVGSNQWQNWTKVKVKEGTWQILLMECAVPSQILDHGKNWQKSLITNTDFHNKCFEIWAKNTCLLFLWINNIKLNIYYIPDYNSIKCSDNHGLYFSTVLTNQSRNYFCLLQLQLQV